MMRRFALAFVLLFFALAAGAHIGSPDVFYDGMAGPYSTRVTIRMPNVVPGRAEISVRVQTGEPVEVSFLPVYSWTPITNTPPADIGRLVLGETNLYSGELWLMSFGAYSVEVHVKGPQGNGVVQIPVNSVALKQLPLPSALGKILLFLAAVLVVGGIGIAAAAGREATLSAGATAETWQRWKGVLSALTMTVAFALALFYGNRWWKSEENAFRRHLRQGPWPDLATAVRVDGNERILRIDVGPKFFQHNQEAPLIPDHGKLMHLFLVREGSRDAFAHLHPIKKKDYTFDVALPPLPEGRYDIFCDLTFEGGMSSTATNSIVLQSPPSAQSESTNNAVERDADDSWAAIAANTVPAADVSNPIFHLPDGGQVKWECQKPLRARQDASLRFSVTDSTGNPVELEPYMGMLCHAAVLRSDGSVFAHLHPSGNFSMAAQMFFADKTTNGDAQMGNMGDMGDMPNMPGMHHMHHMQSGGAVSEVYLPYEFPVAGDYRIWAQFKTGGRVVTAVFDAHVEP